MHYKTKGDSIQSCKILLLNFNYPPSRDLVAGQRWYFFAKYLPQFGIGIDIVCGREKGIDYACDPSFVTRLKPLLEIRKPFNLTSHFWTYPSRPTLHRLLRTERYSAVVTSGPPFFYFVNALYVKKRHPRIPMILDFRDAWSIHPGIERMSVIARVAERYFFPFVEKACMRQSDLLLFATPLLCAQYIEKYPAIKSKSVVLPNGFDEAAFSPSQTNSGGDDHRFFKMLFGGSCDRMKNPQELLRAISQLRHLPLRLTIMGSEESRWRREIARHGLQDMCTIAGRKPYDEYIRELCRADLYLIIVDNEYHAAISTRTYDCLRAGGTILLMSAPGENRRMVEKYSPHSFCVDLHDHDAIASAIMQAFDRWKNGKNIRQTHPEIAKYDRKAIAEKLSSIIRAISANERLPASTTW